MYIILTNKVLKKVLKSNIMESVKKLRIWGRRKTL